jgi:hypothetical protein
MDNLTHGRIIGIDVSRDWRVFIASPMMFDAEYPMIRKGTQPSRILPATVMPSSVSSRPVATNGSFGLRLRQRTSSPDKWRPLK